MRVFGSWARGEASTESNLDLLVALEPGRSLLDLIGLEQALGDRLGLPIDAMTEGGLSPYLREGVLSEARALSIA